VIVRTPALLTPTTTEHVLLPSGREEALPKTTPRFPKWQGEFPWSTYGGKLILDFRGEPLYAEFVILSLLEAEGWSGVWVNSVHRRPFPRRWTPSPIMILPPSNLLDLLDRIYARSGKRSGAIDVLAWAEESVIFAEALRYSPECVEKKTNSRNSAYSIVHRKRRLKAVKLAP
jgi:hypothetical protein